MNVMAIADAIVRGKTDYRFVQQYGGCGRAYVCIGGDRKAKSAVRQAAKRLRMVYQSQGYGVSHALYVGYDNATSKAWSQAEQIAANLRDLGITAYADGVSD